jgi:hypothetical protein
MCVALAMPDQQSRRERRRRHCLAHLRFATPVCRESVPSARQQTSDLWHLTGHHGAITLESRRPSSAAPERGQASVRRETSKTATLLFTGQRDAAAIVAVTAVCRPRRFNAKALIRLGGRSVANHGLPMGCQDDWARRSGCGSAPSRRNRNCLVGRPPAKPVRVPLLPMTR